MVTWPAKMPERARAFATRQLELRERLRWCPPRSRRRRELEAELAQLVRAELQRETAETSDAPSPAPLRREPWWLDQ